MNEITPSPLQEDPPTSLPDLSPAKWIWYPSKRCLPNTFVLFRRNLELREKPNKARGWISADSRYLLRANGERIGWGPAPCDPRWLEADPVDLSETLVPGDNILAVQVLYYGQGDGTWPIGKPGFLFFLEIELPDGRVEKVVSDSSWSAHLARAWPPGHYKRWYLRALQEEFDARLYPYGWDQPGFATDRNWVPALELDCPANRPPICSSYEDYANEMQGNPETSELRPRRIPPLREFFVPVENLSESYWIEWRCSPEEYFECLPPDSYQADPSLTVSEDPKGEWEVNLEAGRGVALTFEFEEQMVGWPSFTIEAATGTVVEVMVQESHEPDGPPLLNTHFHSWSRFICKEGLNRFETFDYESCRFIQLHVHGVVGRIKICEVGMRRRVYPWPHQSRISCSEQPLQRLLEATLNTLHNSAQETCVDGMGRERQPYSGDCGHQLQVIYHTFGETRLPARFLSTFSQGQMLEGCFLDCWPAYDRLARLMQRQLDLSKWGPLVDHGVGFCFDCYHHYLYTGDLAPLQEPYPRLLRFFEYLKTLERSDGLLAVEDIGVPTVWLDHDAYRKQRHKQCAFNLYVAAMLKQAFHEKAPSCQVQRGGHLFASASSPVRSASIRTLQ